VHPTSHAAARLSDISAAETTNTWTQGHDASRIRQAADVTPVAAATAAFSMWTFNNIVLLQWRSVGYRRPGRTAILPSPRSREMPDAPLAPHFAAPLLIAAGAIRPSLRHSPLLFCIISFKKYSISD